MFWRQGDIFIVQTDGVPVGAAPQLHCVLAEGEATGHSHRIDQTGAARLFLHQQTLFLRVTADAAVVTHDEHGPITLPRGDYRVWRQREYHPKAIRVVRD